jgi:hypothetical protein
VRIVEPPSCFGAAARLAAMYANSVNISSAPEVLAAKG